MRDREGNKQQQATTQGAGPDDHNCSVECCRAVARPGRQVVFCTPGVGSFCASGVASGTMSATAVPFPFCRFDESSRFSFWCPECDGAKLVDPRVCLGDLEQHLFLIP